MARLAMRCPLSPTSILAILVLFSTPFTGCTYSVGERQILRGAHRPRTPPTSATNLEITMSDGVVVRGQVFRESGNRIVALYFGGNDDIIGPASVMKDVARRHRLDVYAVNYRGFGPSDGIAGLAAIQPDILPVHDAVAARPEVGGRPLLVWGYSLGTTMALGVAAHRPIDGLILVGAPTSAEEVIPAMRALPWFLHPFVRLRAGDQLLNSEWQPIGFAPQVTAPLLSIHGKRDRVVPIRFGEKVFAAVRSPSKMFCSVEKAGHDDVWKAGGEGPHQCLEAFLAGFKD